MIEVSDLLRDNSILCNEAYWHALNKFSGRAVFIHIPTIKHMDEHLTEVMKLVLGEKLYV